MGIENEFEQVGYGMGNMALLLASLSTGLSNLQPFTRITMTSVKTGTRSAKAYRSFKRGGFYNPAFYANSGSAILSGTSLGLQLASKVCPPLALPLYAGSQTCSAFADVIDRTLGVATFIF
jgi:hypothetical protein